MFILRICQSTLGAIAFCSARSHILLAEFPWTFICSQECLEMLETKTKTSDKLLNCCLLTKFRSRSFGKMFLCNVRARPDEKKLQQVVEMCSRRTTNFNETNIQYKSEASSKVLQLLSDIHGKSSKNRTVRFDVVLKSQIRLHSWTTTVYFVEKFLKGISTLKWEFSVNFHNCFVVWKSDRETRVSEV